MIVFGFFTGMVTRIEDFFTGNAGTAGCNKLISTVDSSGRMVDFIVTPFTYFVGHEMVRVGEQVTGWYDAQAPTPAIYPPRLEAIVMARVCPGRNVKVDFFDQRLLSSDGMLVLNISPATRIVLENGQIFTGSPANRNLVVVYGASTMSIPAQTTPEEIVVLCRYEMMRPGG